MSTDIEKEEQREHESTGEASRGTVFGYGVAILFGAFAFLKWLFPWIASSIVGSPGPLPVPGTLLTWYMTLITIAYFVYIGSHQKTLDAFFAPIIGAICAQTGWRVHMARAVMVLIPLAVGHSVFGYLAGSEEVPAAVRQQHPGMSGSSAAPYTGLKNPHRAPDSETLNSFLESHAESDAGQQSGLDLSTLDGAGKRALYEKAAIEEGRGLYQKNCRPCHGTGHDGVGPMARMLKLKPVAFTDPGTIATLVEDAVFWRVSEGGIGLPLNATPWDSAMPKWGDELSEDERWKIIMAIYDDVGIEPRVLEMEVE